MAAPGDECPDAGDRGAPVDAGGAEDGEALPRQGLRRSSNKIWGKPLRCVSFDACLTGEMGPD